MNLDFNDIREDLKTYLRAQSEFSDYDFDGSGLSVLIDTLAYATHYNALHANAAVAESFMDSALRRNSVVSHAKTIGYTPSSTTASAATVSLTFTDADLEQYDEVGVTIERGSKFIGVYQGETYPFVTTDTYTVTYPYQIDVPISQGVYHSKTFTWHEGVSQEFILGEDDLDRSTINLKVNDVFWSFNDGDLSDVDGESIMFYTQENYNGQTEIYFGPSSGRFGARPKDGDVIEVSYLRSEGGIPNGADVFSIPGLIGGYDAQSISIYTVSPASLGASAESIEDIRFRAPKNYERQNRTVTSDDFKAIIAEKFGNVASINVWGGEKNTPPQYGKVLISIKPKTGTTLSPISKAYIIDEVLSDYSVVGITPVIIDPEYVYVTVNSKVSYFKNNTAKSHGEMIAAVNLAVTHEFSDSLNKFGSTLHYSSLIGAVDNCERAIVSNNTTLQMSKRFTQDVTNLQGVYTLQYYNAIKPGTVISSELVHTGYDSRVLMDDGLGKMTLYNINQEVFESVNMGTVDYNTGIVYIDNFTTNIDIGQNISMYCVSQDVNISSNQNALILLDRANIEMVAI
jgi:hypothetical protein